MKKENTIRIAGIEYGSIVNGPGLRLTIYVQGCPHHCLGCHNPLTWGMDRGQIYSVKTLKELAEHEMQFYPGATFSGGEPMLYAKELAEIAQAIKDKKKTVWCYTGYTYEEALELPHALELLQNVDVLVDGRFEADLKSLECLWRGSTNQRLIDVQQSLEKGEAIEWKSK